MEKNYLLNKGFALSFLLLFSLNFTVLAQSKSGKGSERRLNVSKRALSGAGNVARNGSPTTNPSTQSTTTISACGSYTWPDSGQTYTTSGIYQAGGGTTGLFSDQTAWNNSAAANGAVVSTNNLVGVPAAATINLVVGNVDITMSAPTGMYSSGTFVGTNNGNQPITITFSPGVYGISGDFFTTDVNDAILAGNVTATYSTGQVDSRLVFTDTNNYGYFSTTPITSLILTTTSTSPSHFISLKNLSIATDPTLNATSTLDLTINPVITPTFTAVSPICEGDTLAALPTTSNNGISGTWSPALDNTTTTTYTFTPSGGTCVVPVDMTITVNPITSSSASVSACTSYTWPVNGITYTSSGTYTASVSIPDTQEIDDLELWKEHGYSFNSTIASDNLSGLTATNPINITMGSVNVNLSAPGGMYTSSEAVGTSNPNNPLTISFNPPVYGVSGNYYTTDIDDNIISGNITVTYSNGHVQSRTVTSDTDTFGYFDNNLISSVVISTTTTIPSHYVALKNLSIAYNPHSCSTETLNLTINNAPAPGDTFETAIELTGADYTVSGNNLATNCYTDTNSAIGGELSPDVWYKVILDPCATSFTVDTCTGTDFDTILTIYTAAEVDGETELTELAYNDDDDDCSLGSFQSGIRNLDISAEDIIYVMVEGYNGLNKEQGNFTLNISQTLLPQTVPTFNAVAGICNGDTLTALPITSTNGISGTWSPALNNTTTTTYTFTPNTNECATTATLEIIVTQPTPTTFAAVAPICNGDALSALPTTSLNGYTGAWSPALNNTLTTTYTFTPTAGQCAASASLTITVNQPVTPTFNPVASICNGDSLSPLPTTSINGYTGTWSPALNNTLTTTYTFTPTAGQCATSTTLEIIVNQPITPTFTAIAPICNGDTLVLPTLSNNNYTGTWSPAFNNTASGTYTFTPTAGQCATTASLTVTVNQPITPTFAAVAAICNGDTLSPLPTTSVNGYSGAWSPALNNTTTTTYTFTSDPGQCATNASLTITVNQPITPTFAAVAAICNGDTLSPLPTTSINGYIGTWSPALNNSATTTYTFTPNAGQCANTASLTITVNQPITPTFNGVAAICNGDALSPLPTTSLNGYTGTWSPALNNIITTSYTFTPTAGQCATNTSLTITVNQPITPTFNSVAAICNGDALSPLPTTSTNGYSGSWSPALNNAATTIYTFTPTGGQCATTASLTITVNQPITPTFSAVTPICNGDTLTALPTTSNNLYTGTWSPALNNTATTTYTFTSDAGQCATNALLTITVNQPITPTFTAVAPICNGDTLTALPTTSNNLYTGTWSPALNNTITTTYTFTSDPGQCATNASLTITVNQPITPTFAAVAPICNGSTLTALPTTSINGIQGTWSPVLDNTATTTYTFTPNIGQCGTSTTLEIIVNQPVTPIFDAVADICKNDTLSALPTTSNNGIQGTWSPVLNNAVTTTYTFTPNANECALSTTLEIIVNQPITPTFDPVAAICKGDTLTALPSTSNNFYTGTWSPALNNTVTTTYTFTPDSGQCATTASLTITVNQPITPTFTSVAAICNGDTLTALPTTSNNLYTGTWSPALNNTATTTYTFTSDSGQCATDASLTITVNQPITPTFTAVAPICNGDTLSALPTTSNNLYTGIWSPILDNTATTTYTFTSDSGQCATNASLTITVNQPLTPTFTAIAPICNGDTLILPTTSNNGIQGTWSPLADNTTTTTYTFTPNVGECAIDTTLEVIVNQPLTPIFDALSDICNGDTLTALPTTSNNGIDGTWSPALNNAATTTYTFTPNSGECATTTTLEIIVNQPITPTFNPVATICNGDTLSPLPTTSINGYTGSWSPALNNALTTTYAFTPDGGQCAASASLTITVNQPVTPTFNPVAAICNGETLSPLPTTSVNGYTGTWSPALDNTLTTTYTFTPDSGQCAANGSMTITVNQPVTVPTFTTVGPICNGDTLSALPTTSNNNISGVWSPALNNTLTTTYTFTPNIGQCGVSTTLEIIVNQPVTPTFTAIVPICNGDTLILPTTSNNGIQGTWSPLADNTATTTYTFTPNVGECAIDTTLEVIVNQPVTPIFDAISDICNGDTLTALPTTSNNGIDGTWSPALNNAATTTYTFTPNAGECALSTTLEIIVYQPITPTFNPVATICNGDTLSPLPTTSTNGYTGSWSPALNNALTTTYTFTPDGGQCAASASLTITVNQPVTPTFNPVAAICNGETLSPLPTTSVNGYTGTWSPALDNTLTTTYTFTPDSGQCAANGSLTITVNQPVTVPTFTAVGPICNGDTLSALPTTSNNGITGTWSPALDNTTTTTYTFTPNIGQCGVSTTLEIIVNSAPDATGLPIQDFEVSDGNDATIASIVISPANSIWYGSLADAQSETDPLSSSTLLTNGSTYYAVNVVGTCSSEPFAVTVSVTLGNDGFDNLHFTYYPNPTSSVINLSYSRNITQVTLINLLGQTIMTEKTNSTQVQVDLSRLASATYFIKVASDEQEKVIKVIKRD